MIAIVLSIIVIAIVIGCLFAINAGFKKLEESSVDPAPAPAPTPAPIAPAPAPPVEDDDPTGDDDSDNIETYVSPFD